MTNNTTPSAKSLVKATLLAIVVAAVLLVTVVLPAEYGIDPTGFGKLTGLDNMAEPVVVIEITDILAGNDVLREVEIPDFGDPTPLPNPTVYQDEANAPSSETMTITIPAEGQTEIKMYLQESKAVVFSWSIDQGDIYTDFHGHDPSFGPDFFVRYKEQQEGSENSGSLVAPFSGEHGWYWLNYNEFDVDVTLTIDGYYDEIIDYGIF